MLNDFIANHQLPDFFYNTAVEHYQPIAEQLYGARQEINKPLFIGVNGCQGSGKSTLSAYLAHYLASTYHVNVVSMSLDDFYLSHIERQQLANDIHPLLATRGVPGTHNMVQLKETLDKLKRSQTNFLIPKFDKATDNPFPITLWQSISAPADIIILEGWCWGVEPQTNELLTKPINDLERQHDVYGNWRSYVNNFIEKHFTPLYRYMDSWIYLQAPNFNCVYHWRLEQEQKLIQNTRPDKSSATMDANMLRYFIQHFQRLTEHAMKTLPPMADIRLQLDSMRQIASVYQKELSC